MATKKTTTAKASDYGDLIDYLTGDVVRPATKDEARASERAARCDGGAGVIEVDRKLCYVEEVIA
jgi:hypothetical protein